MGSPDDVMPNVRGPGGVFWPIYGLKINTGLEVSFGLRSQFGFSLSGDAKITFFQKSFPIGSNPDALSLKGGAKV